MKTRVKKLALAIVLLAGCSQDLSKAPIIAARPSAPPPKLPAPSTTWAPEFCRAGEDAGRGLTFTGACALQAASALCRAEEDDYFILVKRALAGGRVFNFYVNVERWHGAGDYRGLAQMQVSVRDGTRLYRWASFQGSLTIAGEGDALSVRIDGARLTAETGTPAAGEILVDGTVACTPSSEPHAAD